MLSGDVEEQGDVVGSEVQARQDGGAQFKRSQRLLVFQKEGQGWHVLPESVDEGIPFFFREDAGFCSGFQSLVESLHDGALF